MNSEKVQSKIMNLPTTKSKLSLSKNGKFLMVTRTETTFFPSTYLYKVLESFKGNEIDFEANQSEGPTLKE